MRTRTDGFRERARYPAVAARTARRQRGAPMAAARAASTRQRLAVVAVPARGFATTANNLVPAALRGLDYVGTVAFAASGTMVAGHAGMDILGCTMVGTITSLGGGTIRDLLLGRTPVFWFREVEYLLLCVGTALAAFYAHDKLEGPVAEEALWWGDTLGIGAFQCSRSASGSFGRHGSVSGAYLWHVHGDVRRPGAGRALPPAAEAPLLGGARLAGRGGYALRAGSIVRRERPTPCCTLSAPVRRSPSRWAARRPSASGPTATRGTSSCRPTATCPRGPRRASPRLMRISS